MACQHPEQKQPFTQISYDGTLQDLLESSNPLAVAASPEGGQVDGNAGLTRIAEQLEKMQKDQRELMDLIQRQRKPVQSAIAAAEMKQIEQRTGKSFLATAAAPRSSAEATLEIAEATEASGNISTMAVKEDTWKRRLNSFAEFSNWFSATMPAVGIAANPLDATPDHLVLYHQAHWVKTHGETVLTSGLGPAPSSLAANFSMLSAVFVKHGRSGEYNAQMEVGKLKNTRIL